MPVAKWDSYRESLTKILDNFKIRRVLEYGSGFSTHIFCNRHDIRRVTTIEHDDNYFYRIKKYAYRNLRLIYEPNLQRYVRIRTSADLIFVDGRERARCLETNRKNRNAIVILHDADREWYQYAIDMYKHKIFTDNGGTCIMTNNDKTFNQLKELLC